MTKCASCRVRHLNCDTSSICTECKKSGRECVRLNVRFRHLVCPSQRVTRADYSKYEFFFDSEQTWTDTNGKLEFVAENDDSASVSPTDELDENVSDAVGLDVESRLAMVNQPFATFEHGATSHTPPVQGSVLDDDPPNYLSTSEQIPHDPPGKVHLDDVSKMQAHSLREESHPGDRLISDTSELYAGRVVPIQNLQEGKLLQHFVTHLAPWVCTKVYRVP